MRKTIRLALVEVFMKTLIKFGKSPSDAERIRLNLFLNFFINISVF